MLTIIISFIVVFIDQLTKYMVMQNMVLRESRQVIDGFFNLTYLRNTGAVWGIFQYRNEWLILLSVVVLILIAVFYRALVTNRHAYKIALGCLIGGIIGNLIDRIKLGWVIDFLDFYLFDLHWPAFNVADSSICIGVAIYLISSLYFSAGFSRLFSRPDRIV